MLLAKIQWLASFPKSGNTWIRAFLRAYQLDAYEPIDVNQIGKISRSESRLSYFQLVTGYSGTFSEEDIAHLRRPVQELIAREIGVHQVVKTHNARIIRLGMPVICDEFTARAIYVVRNPLDLVDSLADHNGVTIDRAIDLLNDPDHTMGNQDGPLVIQYLSTWKTHVESWLSAPFPVLVVRYEDLQSNPSFQFTRMIRFLGWQFDTERVERAIKFSSFDSLRTFERQHGFKEISKNSQSKTFFRRGASSVWKSVLSPKQVRSIVENNLQAMQMFGYFDDPR